MIGIDIVELRDIEQIISGTYGNAFINKVFTKKEINYCKGRIEHFATTFAAKEAVFKALGTGWLDGKDVEILREASGKPVVKTKLSKEVALSLSFTKNYAVAFALVKT